MPVPTAIRAVISALWPTTSNEPGIITNITSYLSENDIKVKTMNVKNNSQKNEVILELYLKIGRETDKDGFARGLQRISGIITVENLS